MSGRLCTKCNNLAMPWVETCLRHHSWDSTSMDDNGTHSLPGSYKLTMRDPRLDRFLVQKLVPQAILPKRGTPYSAGLDLHILLGDWVPAGDTVRFGTGLAFAIPEGFEGHIHPRSSAFYRGLDLDGLIDSDYRGEVLLQIRNTTHEPIELSAGERVAQLVIRPVGWFTPEEADELPQTARGSGGFGSTGK